MNESLVKKYIEKCWNGADLHAFEEYAAPDFTYYLGSQTGKNIALMKEFLLAVHTAFPDWKVDIRDLVVASNSVAVRWDGLVTHKGVFLGIPPTGKQIKVYGMSFYRIMDGKIIEEWEQMDSLGMLMQLGDAHFLSESFRKAAKTAS